MLETPETKWTSVDIMKVVPAKDRNDNPQWELTVRWEWTPVNNNWGERIWVYRESAPSVIEEGRQNVLVEKGNVKNNREGTPYDGTFEWMYRYKIVGWEQLQGTVKAQPSQPESNLPPAAALFEDVQVGSGYPETLSGTTGKMRREQPLWSDSMDDRSRSIIRQVAFKAAVDVSISPDESDRPMLSTRLYPDYVSELTDIFEQIILDKYQRADEDQDLLDQQI